MALTATARLVGFGRRRLDQPWSGDRLFDHDSAYKGRKAPGEEQGGSRGGILGDTAKGGPGGSSHLGEH